MRSVSLCAVVKPPPLKMTTASRKEKAFRMERTEDVVLTTKVEPNASSSATTEPPEKPTKIPMCARCKNHNIQTPLAGHKRYCPNRYCMCPKCTKTAVRQEIMRKQVAETRAKKQDAARLKELEETVSGKRMVCLPVGRVESLDQARRPRKRRSQVATSIVNDNPKHYPISVDGDRLIWAPQPAGSLEGSCDTNSGVSPIRNRSNSGVSPISSHSSSGSVSLSTDSGIGYLPASWKRHPQYSQMIATMHQQELQIIDNVAILLEYSRMLLRHFGFPWCVIPSMYVILKDSNGNIGEAARRIAEANFEIRMWKERMEQLTGQSYNVYNGFVAPTGADDAPTYLGEPPYIGLAPPLPTTYWGHFPYNRNAHVLPTEVPSRPESPPEQPATSRRSETSKAEQSRHNSANQQPRKGKKRSSRKQTATNNRYETRTNDQNDIDGAPGVEYTNVFWQHPGIQHHLPTHNGQRLFAAMSDPSVCGYSAVPVTYAMEPVPVSPMYRLYQPVARPSLRPLHGRSRRSYTRSNPAGSQANTSALTNGHSSLREDVQNYPEPTAYQNGDYASLPPTMMTNNDAETHTEEINSEHRRYSDPGLGPAEVLAGVPSEDSESVESGSSITTVGRSSKLVLSLVEQMTVLKESNNRLFKELQETKADLENVKAEVARFKHGQAEDYQPGMLSDIVREIRDANKVRQEALITKVKSMMEDKPKSTGLDELKNQLAAMIEEKEKTDVRLAKLEDEMMNLKLNSNNEGRAIAAFEEETLILRRELQEARASRTLAEEHAAKLEKLMGMLREKMDGVSIDLGNAEDTRDLVARGLNAASSEKADDSRYNADSDNDFSSNSESMKSSSGNSNLPSPDHSVSCSNNSLSGPVTDL